MAGKDIPVATAIMKTTARHAGALRGSGGVVTVWSRVCAWVRVFPVAGDGLGLHAPGVERHGRTAGSGGEQRDRKAHRRWRGRMDSDAVSIRGHVAPVAVQCRAEPRW